LGVGKFSLIDENQGILKRHKAATNDILLKGIYKYYLATYITNRIATYIIKIFIAEGK
jgi:hypothetical protein